MRLSIVLLTLSTLAAAGPLPPFSSAALGTRTASSAPANYTLGSDPATMIKLKAVYDSLNSLHEIDPGHTLKVKRNMFWDWIKDTFKAPGLKVRSAVPASTPDDSDSDSGPTLAELTAMYDVLNEKRTASEGKADI